MAQITLTDVSKYFGSTRAVDTVNLSIEDGELMVFVGPSGCGKSTTLRMIAGLEAITDGTIHIGDRDVTWLQPKDRNVAMVFQNYALYAHMNVYRNLGFGLKVRGTPKSEIDTRVRDAAAMLGIEELLHRKPKQLSGGQMQRVALGRALVRNPDVFLLDEPLSNLDAKMRVRMREEIAKLHSTTENSMVYVTHDQIEAMTLGDRIAVMKDGRVQQLGRPLEIYDRPANMFVANFIGSPEMNLITGELNGASGGAAINCDGFSVSLQTQTSFQPPNTGKVVLGVRPEHLTLSTHENGAIPAEVVLAEQMGAQTLLVCQAGNCISLSCLTNRNDRIRPGERISLGTSAEHIHLFDPESGATLFSGTSA